EIVDAALAQGLHVALVDKGPLGGTCDNVGCVPSKMVIASADRVAEIQEASRLGIQARVERVDFAGIMEFARQHRAETQAHVREGIRAAERLDWYERVGFFVDERTLQVGERQIQGDRIFIVAGARPLVPEIEGLADIPYLDNESVFELRERPDSLAIIGGGYIAVEFAHFFAAMGTEVTVLQRNRYLVPDEEPEISERLYEVLSRRVNIHLETEVAKVASDGKGYRLTGPHRPDGMLREVHAQHVMLAAGRRSNADLLQVQNAGIETDKHGYIRVNDYLETNLPHVWALGDVTGRYMFKHVANREALFAWYNSQHEEKVALDYGQIPHAIFTRPQVAAVGLTEAQAREKHNVLVGRASYTDVVKGVALRAEEGFAKAIVDAGSRRILGFHIIGPYAPILIQEVINVMATDGRASALSFGLHIHPALPELVVRAMESLQPG
ncbi:MAG: dihydrolipoyl dehydrogenase, partial [Chloroflexi bacterium]|nr:dihydrolipoyl dehydrogenase [Chloroflexota bacterium]